MMIPETGRAAPSRRDAVVAAAPELTKALAVAAAGALVFFALGLPAPWLVGAVMATSAAAVAGRLRTLPKPFRDVVFVLLGASMGAAVTLETLRSVVIWPGSMAALAVAVTAMTAASYLILRRGFGWDRGTAFYASPPGALSATLAMAAVTEADISKVAVAQVFRVFVLVAIAPAAIVASGAHGAAPEPQVPAGLLTIAAILGASVAGALLFHRFKLAGGLMIGAFGGSAALHAGGLVSGRLPDWLTLPTFVALGAIVGTRFVGLAPRTILSLLGAAIASFLASAMIGLSFAVAVAVAVGFVLGLPIARVFVAFAPGALEAMMLTAFLLGLDPAYVGAHHVARFVALSFLVPIVAGLIGAGGERRPRPPDENSRPRNA